MNDLAETLIAIRQDNMQRRLWSNFLECFRATDAQGRKMMKLRGSYNQVPELLDKLNDMGFQIWEQGGYTCFYWAGVFD